MEFSRLEYRSGSAGDLPNPGIEPKSPALQEDSLLSEPPGKPIYMHTAAAAAKSLQLCPTLGDPINSSPPGSSVPGILQGRILEWVAISFSNACMHTKLLQSCLTLCDPVDCNPPGSPVHVIPQARTLERLPCPPGDLPHPGMEPASPTSPALAGRSLTSSTAWEAPCIVLCGC